MWKVYEYNMWVDLLDSDYYKSHLVDRAHEELSKDTVLNRNFIKGYVNETFYTHTDYVDHVFTFYHDWL